MVETKPKYADICQGIARFFQNLDIEVHTDAYQPARQSWKTQEENSNTLIQTGNNRDTKWQKRQKKYNQLDPPAEQAVTFWKYLWNKWRK